MKKASQIRTGEEPRNRSVRARGTTDRKRRRVAERCGGVAVENKGGAVCEPFWKKHDEVLESQFRVVRGERMGEVAA